MKSAVRTSWQAGIVVILGAAILGSVIVIGCAPEPEKPAKQAAQENPAAEPAAQPEQREAAPPQPEQKPEAPSAMPAEPPVTPQPPAEKPAEKPAEPVAKPAEAATKPAEPAEAAVAGAEGLPPAPQISTFAPAEDLVNQVDNYLKDFDKAVASEEEYKDSQGKIVKDANTLIVIALALGMHDQDNKYKAPAAAIMKAARELADTKDYAAAKKGVEALKAAAAGQGGGGGELKWEKVAAIDQLMKQVPLVNTKLKRYVQGARFKSKAKDTAGYAAVLAAIAQGSMADTYKAKNPEEVQKWYRYCTQMRDSAGAVNAAIHAGDQAATDAAMAKLAQSCDECHKAFHPAALNKTDSEAEK